MLLTSHPRFKSFFLLLIIIPLLIHSGCGLGRKLVRPFSKEKKAVTRKGKIVKEKHGAEKKVKKRQKIRRKKKGQVKKIEGQFKVVKKVEPEDLNLSPRPFPPEEKLVYKVKWRGVPIGEIRLIVDGLYRLNNGQTVYRLVYEASTNPFFDVIYKVRDQIVSYFDCQLLIPWKTEKYLREGGYRRNEIVELEQNKGKATYLTSNPVEIVDLKPRAQDILSCFYYYRTKDIELEKSQYMVVFSDRKNWSLEMKAKKKSKINTYLGKIDSILVEPEAEFRGVFFRKAKMQLYFKDDGSKIPVVITAKRPFFGSITATLIRVKNFSS